MSFDELEESIVKYHPSPDLDFLKKVYEFAEKAHEGQVRASGDPYFTHPEQTALLAAKLKLDLPSVAAALLHDTIEDCDVTKEQIAKLFGNEVSDIVEGVTNLSRLEFDSKEVRAAESFRKMFIAMAKDVRVVLVKLCDRLHNMRTLEFVSAEKQRRKATETKEIYAPLANRLGLHWMKAEMEDTSLMYIRPELYQQIKDNYDQTSQQRDQYISDSSAEIVKVLEGAGISAAVKGRAKHFFSIWQKMEKANISFAEVRDLLGFRIIVPSLRACYEALGVVHSHWNPVPGSFKDYIAMPKPNMYQSLHTTLIGPQGRRIEIQIRTSEMDRIAEEGVASHWRYKEGPNNVEFDLQWVRDLVESQAYLANPDEFIQSVKGELFPKEVFVFTPRGQLLRLPAKSSPVDFAYYVHSDVGNQTTGAKVNGSIVPLSHILENGDTVEILTSKNHVPSKDWLDFVKSSKAKQKIRAYLKQQERERSLQVGGELLNKELKRFKTNIKGLEKEPKLTEILKSFGVSSVEELCVDVGYGKLSTQRVISKLYPDAVVEKPIEDTSFLRRIFERAAVATRSQVGVKVSGIDDMVIRFAKCCEPLPGDRIVGFITRGRGVTVHHAECPQIMSSDPQRKINVNWDDEVKTDRKVRISIIAQDQRGLLARISKAVTDAGADIKAANINTTETEKAEISFELSVLDAGTLAKVTRTIEMIPGVIKVERLSFSKKNGDSED